MGLYILSWQDAEIREARTTTLRAKDCEPEAIPYHAARKGTMR